ncbi:hypothetical protein RAS1_41280 [Phycisphaerae bacterium RAS1]|nr:hypothetical protein RAS1_41280 [Phycisphaerae bacterium RAS1]
MRRMRFPKGAALALASACGLCSGLVCTFDPGVPNEPSIPTTRVALDEATANITITRSAGSSSASVSATITASSGRVVDLASDQAISVNGKDLAGPDNSSGDYSTTVTAGDEYTIRVTEPTRGVETTVVDAVDFSVTSPANGATASLAGFSMMWSNDDPNYQVVVEVSQTLFDDANVRKFGPFDDTGEITFTQSDLRAFGQGASLKIIITKTSSQAIDGVAAGTVEVNFSKSVSVTPGP